MEEDVYKTIAGSASGEFKDRDSKFIALAKPVKDEEEIKEILEQIKKDHPKSRHNCYAFRLGTDGMIFRANDAGEPSGTAGKPILGQIDSFELTNILVVVVRYFGGTLLGTSGLINAYRAAAEEALKNARFLTKTINRYYEISCSYEQIDEIMTYIKRENIEIKEQDYQINCKLVAGVRQRDAEQFESFLNNFPDISFKYLYTH